MSVGISMVIDDKFLERLSAADGKLEELAKKSEDVRDRVVKSFRSMGDDGVSYFIQKINEAKAALQGLNVGGSVSLDLKGLDKIPQTATMSADNINTLITSITKLAEANASIVSSSNSATTSIKDMFSIFKEKISDVEKLAKAEEALIKQNEILSRMQNATLSQKQKNVDYQAQLLESKQKTDAINAERNATQELAAVESNRHKEAMNQLQTEAREIQARGIEQKRIADEKVNDAKRATIAVKEEENAIKQSLAEQRRAAMDISLETKKYRNQTKLAAEQDKTATMQAIALERERQAELKRSMEEVKRLAKAYKAMPTLMTGETLNKLLGESASAVSINQRIVAIQNLKNSLKDLDTTDKEYKNNVAKVNAEIARLTKELNGLGVASNNVQKSHRTLMDISGQLARKLALVFSVSQIQGYISKLASVRGEFELQQKSLQVLLQNKDEANKLWQQTVELAVKSPFRVSELVSYTRQLAAYRIETSKLHETTRKLADVSAGLGVDMNRLILAYGQVRAAEYLRGTELRQFTEAGIPMLDELAKRFTELEGRAVSAGDVFERISKRMVGFEDVAAVFDKMTSAGGTFYRMQEEQSETLKGMISNLRDSVDIMLNDIGKSNEWILKGSVNVARALVEQWQILTVVLKSVIALIAIYRIGMLQTSQKMIEAAVNAGITNGEMVKQIKLTQLLSIGWKKVSASLQTAGAVFKASLPLMATTAFLAGVIKVIGTFYEHSKQLEEISKKYAKLRDQLTEISYAFNNAVDEKDIQTQRQKLESLVSLANNEYHMKIKVDLTGATEEDIQKMFGELQTRLTEVNAYANMFETAMQKSTEWNRSDIFDKTQNLSEVIQNSFSILAANVASTVNGLRDNFNELSESEKTAFEILKQPKKIDESDVEYLNRLNEGYSLLIKDAQEAVKVRDQYSWKSKEFRKENEKVAEILNRLSKAGIDYHQIRRALAAQDKAQTAAQEEYNEALDKSAELFKALENIPDKEKEIRLTAAIDKVASEKHWDDFVKYDIMRWTEQRFNIKFNFVPDEKKPLTIWQENYNKQFESYYGYKKIENADTTREKEVQRINGFLKEQKDLVERIQKAGTTKGTAYEGYNLDEEKRKLEDLQKQVEWFGIGDKTTKGKGKDWFSELAKNIKDAHKEFVTLNKDLDEAAATTLMLERYSGVIHESLAALDGKIGDFDISQYDLTTEEGTIQALNDLLNIIPDTAKEAQLAVQKALSDIIGEQTIRNAQQDTKNLIDGIKDMMDGYKLSLELDTMGVPKNLASQLFGIQTFNLDDIKQRIAAEKAADKGISEERLKQLNDLERQITDMEDKARMERLKKYTSYLIAAQSESVKIKLEEARKLSEIESMTEMTPAQKEIAKGAVREEAQKKLDKQQWEDFKNTDLYIELFEDLDNVSTNTLNRMKAKLVEMRDSLKNLDPSQLKDIAKRIEKVNEALVSKNPFKGMFSSIKNVFTGHNEYKKAAEKALVSQEEVDTQKQVVDNLQLQVEAQKKVVYEKSKGGKASRLEQAVEKTYLSQLENQLAKEQSILNKKKEQAKADEKEKNAKKEILELSKQQLSEAAKVLDQQLGALNDIKGSWESVFGNMSDGLSDAFDSVQEIGGGISNVISGLSQGPAGYLQAAAGVMQTIGGIFNIGDKKKERQIQREIKKVEDLQHAYEKLEKAIDDAYAIDTLQRSTKNAQANLRQQIASYERMIAAEQAKKKTDQDRIKEWRYEIEDLKEQLKELEEQAFSQATGGIIDNVLNAATEFTDAWLEAFKETGNGLSGLEDNFNEAVTNMLKQQASMLITSAYVNRWKSELERYINTDDLELTTEEARKWVESVKSSLPQLNSALEEYFNAMKAAGIDLGGDYEMSSLQRGLHSMTEETAQILESYLNSVRFYVAEQNTLLQNIAASLGASTIENPMVEQLKIIASQTTAINSLLQSCTKGGHRLGGMGLKIFMD